MVSFPTVLRFLSCCIVADEYLEPHFDFPNIGEVLSIVLRTSPFVTARFP